MNIFRDQEPFNMQAGSGGAWQQRGGGGVPNTVAAKGDVGDGSVAEIAVGGDEYLIICKGSEMIQCCPVCVFVGVVDVCFDEGDAQDIFGSVGNNVDRDDCPIINI